METEVLPTKSSQMIVKKVWSILRIMLMMAKKGISKSKLIMDFHLLLKRGNHLAGKAINGLILHHNHHPTTNYFFNPNDFEFSCSNSPTVGPIYQYLMMAHRKVKPKPKSKPNPDQLEDPTTVVEMQRVMEMINNNDMGPAASPSLQGGGVGGRLNLPRFGNEKSPLVRQLRVTDSPFPFKDGKGNVEEEEEDVKVNKAADEFIKKFYQNLRMQKSLESPCHIWPC